MAEALRRMDDTADGWLDLRVFWSSDSTELSLKLTVNPRLINDEAWRDLFNFVEEDVCGKNEAFRCCRNDRLCGR